MNNLSIKDRLMAKVDKSGDCWIWSGNNVHGYGRLSVNGRMEMAHRVSWALENGPIPDGVHIDHICRTVACIRPDHLRPATVKQNLEHRGGPTAANKTTGVRGVSPCGKRYIARAGHGGKDYNFGVFDTIAEAEAAAIAGRKSLFTFPESSGEPTLVFTGATTAERRAADAAEREKLLQKWEDEYLAGDSTYTIGARHGLDPSNVFRALKKRGVTMRARGRVPGGKR